MADGNIQRNLGDQNVNVTLQAMKELSQENAAEIRAEQRSSIDGFRNQMEEAVNPFAAQRKKDKKLEAQKSRVKKMMESGEKAQKMLPIQQLKSMADQFQRRNPELKASTLMLLREAINPGDSKEEILRKLLSFYPDVTLADEALEFLLETTEGELASKIREIKEELQEQNSREIVAGRNISMHARQASEKGLGTPTSLRDLYRDITGNPREATSLFEELSQKYSYKDVKKLLDFLLHSLGADMKSKGPSIDRAELHRLFSETRNLQAIMGVYRFFRGRMPLMQTLFAQNGLTLPSELSFETMAKEFMSLASERYPSSDKVLQRSVRLGLEKWIMAKIIALSQFRDAVREVAMAKIYKTLQHRDDLYLAILEALEELEDELEALEEQVEDDEEEMEEEKK